MNIQIVKYPKHLAIDNGRESVVSWALRNKRAYQLCYANITVDFLIHNQILSFGAKVGTLRFPIMGTPTHVRTPIHGLAMLGRLCVTFRLLRLVVQKGAYQLMNTSLRLHPSIVATLSELSQLIPSATSAEVA